MHIEPGVVTGAKIFLSYATAAGTLAAGIKLTYDNIRRHGALSYLLKTLFSTVVVFMCFEVFPHYPVGVSEVHLILGTTLLLVFGVAPAMTGLALGLLIQGIFFAPFDLPQYGMNVTTLLASMLLLYAASRRIIPANTPYTALTYAQVLKLSVIWEGSIVSWVAFWALYGHGFEAENIANIASFASAYMAVVIIEPLIDLAILALAKQFLRPETCHLLFEPRLTNCPKGTHA